MGMCGADQGAQRRPRWSPAGTEPSAQIASPRPPAAELGQKLLRVGLKGCVID